MANNFMIGMVYHYDLERFKNEFRDDFWGLEVCMLSSLDDIEGLRDDAKLLGFNYGIHYPLRKNDNPVRDALFMSLDENTRLEALDTIEDELRYIKKHRLEPVYVLFHYPKPAILKDDFDMSSWRFENEIENVFESKYPQEAFEQNSRKLFEWLTKKGKEYNFIPVLEFDGLNKYITESDFLSELLNEYTDIKLCLDTSRLHYQEKTQGDFKAVDIIEKYAKYSFLLHLSDVKCLDGEVGISHYPVMENHHVKDGWADIKKYLEVAKEQNPNLKIYFEHRSYLISQNELFDSYEWIDSIWNEN